MWYVNELDMLTLAEIMLDGRLLLPELCSQVACFQGDYVKYASGFNLFFMWADYGEIKPNTKSLGI